MPYSSIRGSCVWWTSNEKMTVARAPDANATVPVTCVGVGGHDPAAVARHALGDERVALGADPRHRPEQGDERGQVVRAHVEHRAAARSEKERRVRMPALDRAGRERGEGGHRPADAAGLDRRARLLDRRRQEACPERSRRAVRGARPRRAAPRPRPGWSPAASRSRRACRRAGSRARRRRARSAASGSPRCRPPRPTGPRRATRPARCRTRRRGRAHGRDRGRRRSPPPRRSDGGPTRSGTGRRCRRSRGGRRGQGAGPPCHQETKGAWPP